MFFLNKLFLTFILISNIEVCQAGQPVSEITEENPNNGKTDNKPDLQEAKDKDKKDKINKGQVQYGTFVDENGKTHYRLFRYGFQYEPRKDQEPEGDIQEGTYTDENGKSGEKKFRYGFQYDSSNYDKLIKAFTPELQKPKFQEPVKAAPAPPGMANNEDNKKAAQNKIRDSIRDTKNIGSDPELQKKILDLVRSRQKENK